MDERRSCESKCERLDMLNARDSLSVFTIMAAFIELPTD